MNDIEKIAKRGLEIYEEIKSQYGASHRGKFLAIDIESKDIFLGNTTSEAVERAKKEYPGKIFYVVKIGFSVSEMLGSLRLGNV